MCVLPIYQLEKFALFELDKQISEKKLIDFNPCASCLTSIKKKLNLRTPKGKHFYSFKLFQRFPIFNKIDSILVILLKTQLMASSSITRNIFFKLPPTRVKSCRVPIG